MNSPSELRAELKLTLLRDDECVYVLDRVQHMEDGYIQMPFATHAACAFLRSAAIGNKWYPETERDTALEMLNLAVIIGTEDHALQLASPLQTLLELLRKEHTIETHRVVDLLLELIHESRAREAFPQTRQAILALNAGSPQAIKEAETILKRELHKAHTRAYLLTGRSDAWPIKLMN